MNTLNKFRHHITFFKFQLELINLETKIDLNKDFK